jgi:hypothetical protein
MEATTIAISVLLVIAIVFSIIFILLRKKEERDSKAIEYINSYSYPNRIAEEVTIKYPHLSIDDTQLVIEGLKQYFTVCYIARGAFVSMPSKAVDIAWHELILFTKIYREFCMNALGKFLHHTPVEAMETPTVAQEGIKRTWNIACTLEEINPKKPNKLPLLFAIDDLLGIPDGYCYKLNCNQGSGEYCASDIGCGSCSSDGCGSDCGGSCGGD